MSAWSSALISAFFCSFSTALSASSLGIRSLLSALRAARSRLHWVIASRAAVFASWCSCLIVIWIKLLSLTGSTTGPSDESSAKPSVRMVLRHATSTFQFFRRSETSGLVLRPLVAGFGLPALPIPHISAVSSAHTLSRAVRALKDGTAYSPQVELHLLEIRHLSRQHLAGIRIDLATARGDLRHGPMHYSIFPAQFHHCFHNAGSLHQWQAHRALRP
ncbi:hypothetical protein DFH08DRAFT_805780 [Mycena albidolilacea]|uniref:Secreted protein n=1 Tax=Mycena albidolilacea TaxID=1033008 RepID=A0AAD7A9Z7_9AGAR|nr:hypothetical protein DFH08DRAFT_805780 [Mycena albidolilacea]